MYTFLKKYRRIFLYMLCLGVVVACGIFLYTKFLHTAAISRTPLCKDCNVLLISLDTCGAKHMSTYGYGRDTTPNLTALAKEGILFTNMHTNATWTLPSHVSMFTGLYPMVHQVQKAYDTYLDPSAPLLPDILQKNGYDTYFYAPNEERNIAQVHVYNRGVAHWDTHYWDYRGNEGEYLKMAMNQLENNASENKKTFMFFHTYMCHGPYVTEDQPLLYADASIPSLTLKRTDIFEAPFTEDFYQYILKRLPEGIRNGDFAIAPQKMEALYLALQQAQNFSVAKQVYENAALENMWGETGMGDYQEEFYYWGKIDKRNTAHIAYIQALYDQRVHMMDEALFSVFRELYSASSWSKNTIVIITADHGEEFMEHGNMLHDSLYDANTQVPLVVLIPGAKPQVIQEHAQSVDITPTIVDATGIQNSYAYNGQSLVPVIIGGSLEKRLIIANGQVPYQSDRVTIREGDWKLFVQLYQGTILPYELYNTADDPSEQINVLGKNMGRAKKMIRNFERLKAHSFIMR